MNKTLIACLALATGAAAAQTYVNPHTRKDGAYVEGHFRSAPNSTRSDNYSTQGNHNPYTGDAGTQRPTYGSSAYGTRQQQSGKAECAPGYTGLLRCQ